MASNVNVQLRGPLFEGKAKAVIRDQLRAEALARVEQRLMRKPSARAGLGRRRNTLTSRMQDAAEGPALEVESTLIPPRTVGTAWTDYNVRAARSLLANFLKKAAKRIQEELS